MAEILVLLGFAAFGVALWSFADDDPQPAEAELVGDDGANELDAQGDLMATRVEGLDGDDTLIGDDGDTLAGGAGDDLFEIVIDDPDAAPVVIEDLDREITSFEDDPDRVAFITAEGELVPYHGVLDANLIA